MNDVNWFSKDFFVVFVVMGLATIVILDVLGLRATVSLHHSVLESLVAVVPLNVTHILHLLFACRSTLELGPTSLDLPLDG